jgi:hypothetical protein
MIVSLSETCRVVYQNKVEKYCILLASIIRKLVIFVNAFVVRTVLVQYRETNNFYMDV